MHSHHTLVDGMRGAVRRLAGLRSCERGSVAPLVGVAMIMLVAAVGVAVDIGRGQVAQSKLQSSLDSAGLAAGAMVGQTLDTDDLKPEAEKYLRANFAGETIDASITDFDLELADDQSVVTLEAKATLPTTFMRVFGQQKIDVAARSEITRETKGLEVALVLDVTGSMDEAVSASDSTKKIAALKTSATDLINILFGTNATVDDLYVGIVPFSQSVNVGTDRTDWSSDYATRAAFDNCIGTTNVASTPHCPTTGNNGRVTMSSIDTPSRPSISTRTNPVTLVNDWMAGPAGNTLPTAQNYTHAWGGCFEERYETGDDITDETPDNEPFKVYFYPDQKRDPGDSDANTSNNPNNNWINNGTGAKLVSSSSDRWANKSCPTVAVTPMTNTKATLLTAITALGPRGNTILPTGLVWGWRLISPKWRGKWGGTMATFNLPLEYHEQLSQKAVIFMTDGKNDIDPRYGPYGPLADNNLDTLDETTAETVKLKEKTLAVCASLKENGVLIYTIVFGSGSDPLTKGVMKSCASEEDFYFDSPSQTALKAAFRAIGDSLSKLRVSK